VQLLLQDTVTPQDVERGEFFAEWGLYSGSRGHKYKIFKTNSTTCIRAAFFCKHLEQFPNNVTVMKANKKRQFNNNTFLVLPSMFRSNNVCTVSVLI